MSTRHDFVVVLDELTRAVNVLFVGLPGVGKSAVINLLHTLISDKNALDRVTEARNVDNKQTMSLTQHLSHVARFGKPAIREGHKVAVYDSKGLTDWEAERRTVEFLLDGRFQTGERINQPSWFSWRRAEPKRNISVVFFVLSALHPVPVNLVKVVKEECRTRGVPVVCLITKADRAGQAKTIAVRQQVSELFGTDFPPVCVNADPAQFATTRDDQAADIFEALITAVSLGDTAGRVPSS